MSWPFLYYAGDRLSPAELMGARLDGDLVEVGEAYMPADTVETSELRAVSLRPRVPADLAVTRQSAAWVYGAVTDAPARHRVQRRSTARLHHDRDPRLDYREHPLPAGSVTRIGGVWVTTPARTLADLARAHGAGEPVAAHIDGLVYLYPHLVREAVALLQHGPAAHYKRHALAHLRALAARTPQEEVTR